MCAGRYKNSTRFAMAAIYIYITNTRARTHSGVIPQREIYGGSPNKCMIRVEVANASASETDRRRRRCCCKSVNGARAHFCVMNMHRWIRMYIYRTIVHYDRGKALQSEFRVAGATARRGGGRRREGESGRRINLPRLSN